MFVLMNLIVIWTLSLTSHTSNVNLRHCESFWLSNKKKVRPVCMYIFICLEHIIYLYSVPFLYNYRLYPICQHEPFASLSTPPYINGTEHRWIIAEPLLCGWETALNTALIQTWHRYVNGVFNGTRVIGASLLLGCCVTSERFEIIQDQDSICQ